MGSRMTDDVIIRTGKRIRGFGLSLFSSGANSGFVFWSLGFKHIARQLQARFKNRYLVVYNGTEYACRDLTIHETMTVRGIPHTRLKGGCVAIPGNKLLMAAHRLSPAILATRLQFVDADHRPPYTIWPGYKKRLIELVTRRGAIAGNIPHALGSSLNCSVRDELNGVIVVKPPDETWLGTGLLEEMFRREFGRLHITERASVPFRVMPATLWRRVSPVLRDSGITVIRKDIRLHQGILSAQCWLGYPEGYRGCDPLEKSFLLHYALRAGKWSMGPITATRYPYPSARIVKGWRFPSGQRQRAWEKKVRRALANKT